jgi:hypothetical protein
MADDRAFLGFAGLGLPAWPFARLCRAGIQGRSGAQHGTTRIVRWRRAVSFRDAGAGIGTYVAAIPRNPWLRVCSSGRLRSTRGAVRSVRIEHLELALKSSGGHFRKCGALDRFSTRRTASEMAVGYVLDLISVL